MKAWRWLPGLAALCAAATGSAADLSPGKWPEAERIRLEKADLNAFPTAARAVEGRVELVSGIASRVAVHAGQEALRQGGNAADAAVVVALTQVSTSLGATISYAGVSQLVYFDARSGKVYALDGGWKSYSGETDPASIPAPDVSVVTGQPSPPQTGDGRLGRQTLVPGFMAAMGALHARFGRLPFADLFQPAIWYAEKGVEVSQGQAYFFGASQAKLWRTDAGRRFASMPDGSLPKAGDLFRQPDLARTLREVAKRGPDYMYRGDWARMFVDAVRAEGGKATLEDLATYRAEWREPLSVNFRGATVYAPNDPTGPCTTLEALSLLLAMPDGAPGPYWRDPQAFQTLRRALRRAEFDHAARENGKAADCRTRLSPNYAAELVKDLEGAYPATPAAAPVPPGSHTQAVVVVDRWGNVAALSHSINTVFWGGTGIVVGGVPIPDAAAINRARLTKLTPGGRLPNDMSPLIALREGRPVVAIAPVGSSLFRETVRLMVGALTRPEDVAGLMAAPPLLLNIPAPLGAPYRDWPEAIPAGAYDPKMLEGLQALGVRVEELPWQRVLAIRGTAVMAVIDQPSGAPRTVETPGVFGFAESDLQGAAP